MQHSLEAVLEDYIYACNAMTDACNLAPSGEYEVSFNWGDGVLEDKDKEQAIQLNEVNSGIRKRPTTSNGVTELTISRRRRCCPKAECRAF